MDVDNIQTVSNTVVVQQPDDVVSAAMLKKSLSNQAMVAAELLQTIPPPVNPNIGSIVDTTA